MKNEQVIMYSIMIGQHHKVVSEYSLVPWQSMTINWRLTPKQQLYMNADANILGETLTAVQWEVWLPLCRVGEGTANQEAFFLGNWKIVGILDELRTRDQGGVRQDGGGRTAWKALFPVPKLGNHRLSSHRVVVSLHQQGGWESRTIEKHQLLIERQQSGWYQPSRVAEDYTWHPL